MVVDLPYGRTTYHLRVDDAIVVAARGPGGPAPRLESLLASALDQPIGAPPLEDLVRAGDRVTIAVSDTTRDEPRAEMLAALRARLPEVRLTVAVATGTHGPCDPAGIGLDIPVVMHDGRSELVAIGTTSRGTPVRVHRVAVEADLVIATGAIRPHYFAGFGAGVKAIFPGLGGALEIRKNHELKVAPGSRAGVVDGNPCREDLEEVLAMLPPSYLLNVVVDPDELVRATVAGDVRRAFRAGADLARSWYAVRAPPARAIVVSDALPLTASLYQASKLVAAVAPLLAAGGTIVVVAECGDGIGPVDVVNRAIYDIGLRPRLPADHRIVLVSSLSPEVVAPSYARWAARAEDVLAELPAPIVVAPRAGHLIIE